jgi:Amt family ammonium transporter
LGHIRKLWVQIESVLVTIVYAFVVTWVILKMVGATMRLRVSEGHEVQGLDLSRHGETAYNF